MNFINSLRYSWYKFRIKSVDSASVNPLILPQIKLYRLNTLCKVFNARKKSVIEILRRKKIPIYIKAQGNDSRRVTHYVSEEVLSYLCFEYKKYNLRHKHR